MKLGGVFEAKTGQHLPQPRHQVRLQKVRALSTEDDQRNSNFSQSPSGHSEHDGKHYSWRPGSNPTRGACRIISRTSGQQGRAKLQRGSVTQGVGLVSARQQTRGWVGFLFIGVVAPQLSRGAIAGPGQTRESSKRSHFSKRLRRRESCEWIDTSKLTEADRMRGYFDAVGPSVLKKYKIRQVFGSRPNSGWLFGKTVPALIVIDPEKRFPEDVFPHKETGRVVTIREFLQKLVTGPSLGESF